MKVTLWGTRGSIATPGPDTTIYGGNTSCVEVRGNDGTILVLDAGTGLRRLGANLPRDIKRVDVLLTHLHMDHIQGLGFFAPLYNPDMEVHLWGPRSVTMSLHTRLSRYLSPPLFPVHLRDLPCRLTLHDVPTPKEQIGEFCVESFPVCHPGPTVGYRITSSHGVLAYMPDHEPVLASDFRNVPSDWVSGYSCANDATLLIHDAQYTREQYPRYVGWGHSSMIDAVAFAKKTNAKHIVLFHHDPSHDDDVMLRLGSEIGAAIHRESGDGPDTPKMTVAREGDSFLLRNGSVVTGEVVLPSA